MKVCFVDNFIILKYAIVYLYENVCFFIFLQVSWQLLNLFLVKFIFFFQNKKIKKYARVKNTYTIYT